MPDCTNCGKYTKYQNGLCLACYNDKKQPKKEITKKEEKARVKSTPQALKLSDALREVGIPTKLEQWDGHKHIDIAIPEYKLNIEVDGGYHNTEPKQALADLKRTFYSFKKGYFTLRIPNSLVENHFQECVDLIVEMVNIGKDKTIL
jgi:very-short-patch-repair endonuclease